MLEYYYEKSQCLIQCATFQLKRLDRTDQRDPANRWAPYLMKSLEQRRRASSTMLGRRSHTQPRRRRLFMAQGQSRVCLGVFVTLCDAADALSTCTFASSCSRLCLGSFPGTMLIPFPFLWPLAALLAVAVCA